VKTKSDSLVPCATTPCQNGGQCQLLATNIYGCVCRAEFTGTQCETSTLGRMIVLKISGVSMDDCLFSYSSMCNHAINCMSKWRCMHNKWSELFV
jgi:hypothetical protein